MWTRQDFKKSSGMRPCVACDVPLIIAVEGKVSFK